MNLIKYFDINPPKTASLSLPINKQILYSILYNHNGIKDSNFQFPRDMNGLTHFLNNFTLFQVCVNSKVVIYSSFKGTVAKKVPCHKNNLSKKGNVVNDISFPCKGTKKVTLYINLVSIHPPIHPPIHPTIHTPTHTSTHTPTHLPNIIKT